VIGILKQLQAVSKDHHLPAFRRCLKRTANLSTRGGPGGGKRAEKNRQKRQELWKLQRLRMPVCLIMVAEILNSGFVHECSDFTN
jgi:hypothetical protein